MQRIQASTAAAALPATAESGTIGYFTDGDPAVPTPATVVTPEWLNRVQEELCYVIEQAGITLDGSDNTQLHDAILLLTSSGTDVAGGVRNARMSVTAASASATFTADEVVVVTALGGASKKLGSYSQSINLSTTGAGGMDTGSAPASGFVSLYAIYNPSTATASILACSTATSSGTVYAGGNMPSGYTASALIGVWPTNGSGQFKAAYLHGREVWLEITNAYASDSGVPTTLTSLSLSSIVPSNAKAVFGFAGSNSTSNRAQVIIAGSASGIGASHISITQNGSTLFEGYSAAAPFGPTPMITAQTIFFMSSGSGTSTRIDITGYTF